MDSESRFGGRWQRMESTAMMSIRERCLSRDGNLTLTELSPRYCSPLTSVERIMHADNFYLRGHRQTECLNLVQQSTGQLFEQKTPNRDIKCFQGRLESLQYAVQSYWYSGHLGVVQMIEEHVAACLPPPSYHSIWEGKAVYISWKINIRSMFREWAMPDINLVKQWKCRQCLCDGTE
jgi:hypothetical protein